MPSNAARHLVHGAVRGLPLALFQLRLEREHGPLAARRLDRVGAVVALSQFGLVLGANLGLQLRGHWAASMR
jgi:hypothetical protein